MKRINIIVAIFTVIAMSASCALLGIGGSTEFPEKIGFAIPSTLTATDVKSRAAGDTTETGVAYSLVKQFVINSKNIVDNIDNVLSVIGSNKSLFIATKGIKVPVPSGEWFFFNDQSDGTGYYIYFGENDSTTNFYMDFERVDTGKFKGKAVYFAQNMDTIDQGIVYFDNSVAEPYIDAYVDYSDSTSYDWEFLHCKMVKIGEGEIKVYSKSIFNNTPAHTTEDWAEGWDMVAYAKEGEPGGALAYGQGYVETNVSPGYTNLYTNYIYKEYFNTSAQTTYMMTTFDAYTNNTLAEAGMIYPVTTFTNGDPEPTAIKTILDGMTRMTVADYPTITLP